jgi:hypothetical protein
MKRILLTVALALAACADNRTSIEITGRAAPDGVPSCKFSSGGDEILGPGTLDVNFPSRTYSTVLYVTNNLADPTTAVPEATTASKAWRATAARVRVNPQDYVDKFGASPALLSFQGENTIPLDGTTTAPAGGQSAQFVDVISSSLGAQLATAAAAAGQTRRVVLGITLQGLTLDGARVDTGEWFFPVDVCTGCLVPGAASGVNFATDPPSCTDATKTFSAGNCFGVGQDTVPTCAAATK